MVSEWTRAPLPSAEYCVPNDYEKGACGGWMGSGVGRWDEYGELELVAGDGWLDGEWMAERTMWLNICGCGGDYGKISKICGCDPAGGMLRGLFSGARTGAGVGCRGGPDAGI